MKKRSILVFVSIGAIIGIVATTLILVRAQRVSKTYEKTQPQPSPTESDTAMDRLYQVSTRDGRTEWKLEAASAQMDQDKQLAKLKDVSVVFYPKSGGEVSLTADRGIIHTDSKDIVVVGNVVVVNQNYKMVTQRVKYSERKKTLTTTTPLAITNETSSLLADRMVYEITKNKSVFSGNVMGIFSDQTMF